MSVASPNNKFYWGDELPDHPYNAIGSFTLPRGVQWTNQGSIPKVAQEIRYTLSGAPHSRTAAVTKGFPIVLSIQHPYCRLNESRLQAVEALEQVEGATYTFQWRFHDLTTIQFTVIFDHTVGKAVSMSRWTGQGGVIVPVDVNMFIGTINLMVV